MALNTSKSIEKTSTALAPKCEATIKNMKTLLAKAGVNGDYKTTKVLIPRAVNSGDDVLYIGLNGIGFWFKRNTSVNMPDPLLEIMQNTGMI